MERIKEGKNFAELEQQGVALPYDDEAELNGAGLNTVVRFFSNKWTKFGFSFISIGYLWFLGQMAWLTFGYHFVFDNAAAAFFAYTFINVMFAVVMIYTRNCLITYTVTMFMHPLILLMFIFGFGNWYLILPPFVIATVIFLASGANESLKVILGTTYMLLFVLAFLAYIALESFGIKIPGKMELHLREYPDVPIAYSKSILGGEPPPLRLIAYVDPPAKESRSAAFFIERTDLDRELWNVRFERTFGSVRVGNINPDRDFEIRWHTPHVLFLDGRLIEIDEDGNMVTVDNDEVFYETELIS